MNYGTSLCKDAEISERSTEIRRRPRLPAPARCARNPVNQLQLFCGPT